MGNNNNPKVLNSLSVRNDCTGAGISDRKRDVFGRLL